MKNYLFLLFAVILLVVLGAFMQVKKVDKELHILHNSTVYVIPSCVGQEVSTYIEITTNSDSPIAIHSFALGSTPFKISIDDKEVTKSESLQIKNKQLLRLKLSYIIDQQKAHSVFSFKSDYNKHELYETQIRHGEVSISSDDVANSIEQVIDVSSSCLDSVKVHFPHGGTITSIAVFTDSNQLNVKPIKSLSYMLMDTTDYITFSRVDTGRYFVSFGSCHWGNIFWMHVK